MIKAMTIFLFVFAIAYGNSASTAIQLDTSLNKAEYSGKMGIVTCPAQAEVKSVKGNNCRTKQSVSKEITGKIEKCKYALSTAKAISAFKGTAAIFFEITSDGYLVNYKVVKTDIKRKSILKDIEDQIRSAQFAKSQARDCVSEITCNFKLKTLTLKNKKP